MQTVLTALNTSVKEHKEHFYEARRSRHQLICDLTGTLNKHVATLEKIEQVIQEQDSTDAEKVTAVKTLLSGYKPPDYTEVKDQLALLRKESNQILKDEDYYNILESRSVKLQNRVSAIVSHLDFDKETSNKKIIRAIEKQLNKLESSNKFGKAVFYGSNQEFQQPTKEEQLVTEGCKRLIENAIICWNYLYLSQLIFDAETDDQKNNLVQTIKNGSPVTWQHINLQGEYDFSEKILQDSFNFRLPELMDLSVGKTRAVKF